MDAPTVAAPFQRGAGGRSVGLCRLGRRDGLAGRRHQRARLPTQSPGPARDGDPDAQDEEAVERVERRDRRIVGPPSRAQVTSKNERRTATVYQ